MTIDENFFRPLSEKIQIRTRVASIDLNAEDWELFSDMPGAAKAAREINNAFMDAVNDGCSREEVREGTYAVMSEYGSLGAQDTEPRATLEDLLDLVFGGDTGRYSR